MTVNPDQEAKYLDVLGNKKCYEINSYLNSSSFRNSIELVVLCKALYLAGIEVNFKFQLVPNYVRSLLEVEKGNALMAASTAWEADIDDAHLYKSEAVFKSKEFVKGFYTTPALIDEIEFKVHEALNHGTSPVNALRQYSFLSAKHWVYDWHVINALSLPVASMSGHFSLCRMLAANRAQVYMGEMVMIGRDNWAFPCDNIKLLPIEGIKLSFIQSRHYAISKTHPHGKKVYEALNIGIKKLRSSGELVKALYPLSHQKVILDSWVDLYPKQ
ncbi:hypothetical protein [Catenovulum maritimum]|uniref:Solute-binding protein family 3/N-terminal domain-containing protein n=1 Tax=Catenovulum maritimum TaxID=1513271 RepID=A0A0J8GZN8_9ALTE|nr:hypothetical protein [Catenovulum maritimum]KMT66699.1 hypothetical protein XM47_00775 [Catenovulum maritimum]